MPNSELQRLENRAEELLLMFEMGNRMDCAIRILEETAPEAAILCGLITNSMSFDDRQTLFTLLLSLKVSK